MSDFTNGAHECFCDRKYKDANKLASCGDCPRDYIAGAWDARRKYIEHLKKTDHQRQRRTEMTDRYERIRAALAMGPTPGPWRLSIESPTIIKQDLSSIGLSRGGVLIGSACGHESSGFYPTREQSMANARLIAACDPDTIRALLEERDALAATLAAMAAAAKRHIGGKPLRLFQSRGKTFGKRS